MSKESVASQMAPMATRGSGTAEVDSSALTGLESATSVRIPIAASCDVTDPLAAPAEKSPAEPDQRVAELQRQLAAAQKDADALNAALSDGLRATAKTVEQCWADRCGIDWDDERAIEPHLYGWPDQYAIFLDGWNAVLSKGNP